MGRIPLAWLQLMREKRRLFAALAGISFAVMLMLMQLGFLDALFLAASLVQDRLHCDLAIVSRQYDYLLFSKSFTQRRLYQCLAFDGVESVTPLYVGMANWKHPDTHKERTIFVLAFNPESGALDLPGVAENLAKLQMPDVVLFDVGSRSEFGPVVKRFRNGERIVTEVNGRKIEVVGLFELGTSFGANGNLITSDLNFLRLFTVREKGLIDVGLIKLKPGVDAERMRTQLESFLPGDVRVMTRRGFSLAEKQYWANYSPIGFIFGLGTFMGLIVGAVIVYQILYTDVTDHLAEYATLKAMGYSNRYLYWLVIQEAMILAALGYFPGLGIAQTLYVAAHRSTLLPIFMTISRALIVFLLTVFMCGASALLAVQKLKSADPAEIFG